MNIIFKLLVALFLPIVCLGQAVDSLNLDGKYTPPSNSFFDSSKPSSNLSRYSDITKEDKNLFTVNALLLFRGIAAATYARPISSKILLHGTVGASVFPDYIFKTSMAVVMDPIGNDPPSYNDPQRYWPDYIQANSKFSGDPKLFYELGFKFFPNEVNEGLFIGFSYRNYASENTADLHTYDGSKFVLNRNYKLSFTSESYQILYGYSIRGKKTVNEFYMGVGYRNLKMESPTPIYTMDSRGDMELTDYKMEGMIRNQDLVSFLIGYNLYFSF